MRPQPESSEPIVVMPPQASVDLMTSTVIAELTSENVALREQVAQMAATMASLKRQVLEASEGELVHLALVVAERVVGRELATDPTLVALWAREAIDGLAAKDEVVIAVARDVAQQVPDSTWATLNVSHRVQTDPQLVAGSIEVRTPAGIVETSADARLSAVAQALGVERP
jgi:flagellar assembly protein FliH